MSLDHSISSLVTRLGSWSQFPKYSLERRIDIFLTPFVESYVSRTLGTDGARFVAPEFPILAGLRDASDPQVDATGLSRLTVNVDYVLRVPRARPTWLFVELKTDPRSFDSDQAKLYARARERSMRVLVDDLDHVAKKSGSKRKYAYLKQELAAFPIDGEPIEIAYLAPEAVRERAPAGTFPPARLPGNGTPAVIDHFFSLESFADQGEAEIPEEHRALWPFVRRAVQDVLRSCSRTRRSVSVPGHTLSVT